MPPPVSATGLSVVVAPAEPSLDIVFVHGFTGHPESTWTCKARDVTNCDDDDDNSLHSKNPRHRLFSRSSYTPVYWPRDLLPDIVPNARVMVYGYDTRIRHFFGKPPSQNTVYDIAGDFLIALEANRRMEPGRPILFVVHSLGGIVAKEMLRRSSGCDMNRTHLRTVFESTMGIMFFGTPHGGADPRGLLHHITEKIIRAAGFQPNDQIVNTLLPSSERLKELRDEFGPIAQGQGWIIHSFQEELGVKVLSGRKVVEDTSSYLNIPTIEITEHIERNHMDMCRFTGPDDSQYKKVAAALQRLIEHLSQQPKGENSSKVTDDPKMKQRQDLLKSLNFEQIDFRRITIKKAHTDTCLWLLECPIYLNWNDLNKLPEHCGFLWLRGKAGAGKSTIMKFALDNAQAEAKDGIIISFFFNAQGDALEKSTAGMYRSLLLQLLRSFPRLQCVFDSLRLIGSNNREYQWSIEPLKDLFEQVVLKLESTSVTCFIDALDECEEGQVREMVSFFQHLGELVVLAKINFRVCLSSRYYPHITINKGYDLELESENGHKQDIVRYLDNKLEIGQSKLAKIIRDEIQVKASGVFMWVVLVVEILNKDFDDGRLHALQARLKEIPYGLHELFHQLLTRDNRNREELLLCIRWVLFARRMLSPKDLYFAILSGSAPKSLELLDPEEVTVSIIDRFILSSSKGLIEITRPAFKAVTVQFIHESVRDYFLKDDGLQRIWPDLKADIEADSHELLKQCCLNYIQSGIASKIEFNTWPPDLSGIYMPRPKSMAYPFFEYSVSNILHHAEAAQVGGIDQLKFIQKFRVKQWVLLYRKLPMRRLFDFKCPSLLYLLAVYDMPALVRRHPSGRFCFRQEDEFYGMPIFAALCRRNTSVLEELLRLQTEHQPSNSSLYKLYEQSREADFFINKNAVYASHPLSYWKTISRLSYQLIFEFYSSSKPCDTDLRLIDDGQTALTMAVKWAYPPMVELLLDKDSNIEERDSHGRSPLSWAVEQGEHAMTELLLHYGADFDTKWSQYGQSSISTLSNTAEEGHAFINKLLPKGGADTKPGDCRGWTLLHGAAYYGNLKATLLFLDRGARIQPKDEFGKTPLMLAACNGRFGVSRLLIERGADLNTRDNEGKTAYEYAALYNHENIMELLEDAGANT